MSTTLFIIIVLTIVFIYLFFLISQTRSKHLSKRTDSLYTLGLNHMLHDENKKAIETFKEYLKVNTKNIDAYIKLGGLLRNNHQQKNALNIHENLLFRQDITKGQKLTIIIEICKDYIALNQYAKAIDKAKVILKLEKNNRFATENLYQLYRDNGDWENSIDYLKKNSNIEEKIKKRMMAIYKVQEGIDRFYKNGKYHDARLIFRKAIKYDANCEMPYYYIGLSYVIDQREKDAVDWWEKFVEVCPPKAYLVFPQLKKILFNLGKFERIDIFLKNILKKSPNNIETIISLAEFHENKGDINQAIAIVDEHLKSKKDNIKLQISLAKFYAVKNDSRKSAKILIDVLNNFNNKKILLCSKCGNEVKEATWLCPNCKEIDTYIY